MKDHRPQLWPKARKPNSHLWNGVIECQSLTVLQKCCYKIVIALRSLVPNKISGLNLAMYDLSYNTKFLEFESSEYIELLYTVIDC